MAEAVRSYSSFFSCLHDQPEPINGRYGAHSIFRAVDSRDVEQKPTTLPRVHDFAVIWDDDHDTRIIPVIEEMLMAGLLPGVQFIGEHKAFLTVVLAARTYWAIDVDLYKARIESLASCAANDFWNVEIGMYDRCRSGFERGHQCDFKDLLGYGELEDRAFLFNLDSMWHLGTKEWVAADSPTTTFFDRLPYYAMRRPARSSRGSSGSSLFPPPPVPVPIVVPPLPGAKKP